MFLMSEQFLISYQQTTSHFTVVDLLTKGILALLSESIGARRLWHSENTDEAVFSRQLGSVCACLSKSLDALKHRREEKKCLLSCFSSFTADMKRFRPSVFAFQSIATSGAPLLCRSR